MKSQVCFLLFSLFSLSLIGQKTLLVEKTGRSAKYYYHLGDKIKLRTSDSKTIYKGILTDISDSSVIISSGSSDLIKIKDITCVYKQFLRTKKLGIRLIQFSGIIFGVITINNLITNSRVFTQYSFIVSGAFLGGGIILLALSERQCKIGVRWNVKTLDGNFN
jgi:hypothetical protein